jgi:hypothetical protein
MPEVGMRSLQRVSYDRARDFVVGGVIFLVLGAFMTYLALT